MKKKFLYDVEWNNHDNTQQYFTFALKTERPNEAIQEILNSDVLRSKPGQIKTFRGPQCQVWTD